MVLRPAMLSLLVALLVTPIHRAFAQAASSGYGGHLFSLGAVIEMVAAFAVVAFFFRKKLHRLHERDRIRLAEIGASTEGIQKLRAQQKGVRIVAIVIAVLAVLATILLLIKINNTSNWALRYDGYVQEQLGWWIMGVGLLWLLAVVVGSVWFMSSRTLGRMVLDRVATIRTRLVEIEKELETRVDQPKADLRSERQLLESELRQLGA
ncbi:MAG TPA: hypothetical protein VF226_10285 [Hyphomicrobiaceae bacterium]